MFAGTEAAAAQLEHLKNATLTFGRALCAERNDRVGYGEFGRVDRPLSIVFADPKCRGRDNGEPAGQIVKETPELRFVGREGA